MTAPDPIPGARERFILDPAVAFLNHGSFGATPRDVLQAQDQWRAQMEADPVLFLDRRWAGLLDEARGEVCSFLDADPDGFAFMPNATTAINTVVASLGLGPGDEVVFTDHAYPAVSWLLRTLDARPVIVDVPLGASDVTDRVMAAVTPATRLVVVDHVTSMTGAIFPVEQIVRACRDRGLFVVVDAAHAPGMVPLSIRSLAPDAWAGNFHKWVCAPKGAGGLWVAPQHRDRIRPVVTSHEHLVGFHERLEWQGTDDPTPALSVPAALRFAETLGGWERIRAHNEALVEHGRAMVAAAIGTPPVVPRAGSMAIVVLPDGMIGSRREGIALTRRLYDEHRIEVPVLSWGGKGLIRLSAHVYNRPEDYERLAAVAPSLRG